MYIWQHDNWPNFTWDRARLLDHLAEAARRQGQVLGQMRNVIRPLSDEARLRTLSQDALRTSEIEGEHLDEDSVRSSIARRLGIPYAGASKDDRRIEGLVDMLIDATHNYDQPLTAERLFGWHVALFPTGYSGMHKITVAGWRLDKEGPMQVVSGALGREKVHYEAPPAERLPAEMDRFLAWFNAPPAGLDGILRSGIAHLYYVTIHPTDDGNGRMARAMADMALAQAEASPHRFYSMSSAIRNKRKAYYEILESTQSNDLEITDWLVWYLECFVAAIDEAEATIEQVLAKQRFWQNLQGKALSERQTKVLNRLLDGFEGKITTRKWAALGKCSQPTAQRDINELIELGALRPSEAGGRSTAYLLNLD
ncbi:MAG: DUF4172 domain-containing protein [Kiloniellaceae bacterium]|nr:DUF4172 domain-containing protein [Kiloniellaceae bacterium]